METIINELKNTAAGPDGISSVVVKMIFRKKGAILERLINISLNTGLFPKSLKLEQIVPIYKKGDKKILAIYRPTSILNAFAKVIEKAVKIQLMNFLEKKKKNFLATNQFGFRKGRDTNQAITTLTKCVYININKGKKVLALFLDFSKAFDTVNHELLLKGFIDAGFTIKAFEWLKSYMNERTQ